jgi:hypothetical protein
MLNTTATFGFGEGPSALEVCAGIKSRLTVTSLLQRLVPGWTRETRGNSFSPLRDDGKKPSFSIDKNDALWYDYGLAEGGDVITLYQKLTDCTKGEAIKALKEFTGTGTIDASPIIRTPKPSRLDEPKRRVHPVLSIPTEAELKIISRKRKIRIEGLRIAVQRGLLHSATLNGYNAWVLTDVTLNAYNARRLDGYPWDNLVSNPKAWLLYGSRGDWPIGIQESESFPIIVLCEGGPDFLAAFDHAWSWGIDRYVAPVCMSSSAPAIPDEAIPFFSGKRVQIFVHDDAQGLNAFLRWNEELESVASKVDGFGFGGLLRDDGSPVTDLCDLLRVEPKSREQKLQVESLMDFTREETKCLA